MITQCSPPGVTRAQRGIARRISADAVLAIAVARAISADIGIPMVRALEVATGVVGGGGRFVCRGGTVLSFDVEEMRAAVGRRLVDAAEVLVAPRRGRPPAAERRDVPG